MTYITLVKLFREGKMKTVDIVIAPSISLEAFANRCGNKLEADTIDFVNIINDNDFLDSLGFNPQTVYAMILPDKYNLYWHTQADELLIRLFKEYKKFWSGERLQKLQRTGLTQLEVSILASIVAK
ncbi:MAG: endolytic transglycosylase MltG, partial [Bacteroidia bacterium]|nr:endolytic transglycosylase MltG [Bacteroidia bacterium]